MNEWQPYHDPTGDWMAHQRYLLMADKIEADPSLLHIPLENMERWLARGHMAKRQLAQWRTWIEAAQETEAGMKRLLDFLRDDSEESRDWKGFSPFAGILTDEEMAPYVWTSRH